MNEIGMAVDLSHCSDRTTLDAIEASAKPVLITHSNCRSLAPASLRCKTDEAIRRLAAKGGVFGVSMIRSFVRSSGPVTIDHLLDHVDHIARIAGIQSVGLGTDVDLEGRDRSPSVRYDLDGAQYPQKVFDIAAGLFKRGYSQQDVALVLGGNFQRVLQDILPSA
jgi:membrane dipeptidase